MLSNEPTNKDRLDNSNKQKKTEIKFETCKNTPGILWDRPGMVASSIVGISPLLQSMNNYLPSIGWKGMVPGGCARKMKQK